VFIRDVPPDVEQSLAFRTFTNTWYAMASQALWMPMTEAASRRSSMRCECR